MAKKMLIDATHPEETRVVVVDGQKVDDFDFESITKRQLAGNIYLAKVTRVEPSLQAAFVEYGGNRHGFLAFSEVHPDYYQIPVADREALLAEEEAEEQERRAREERGESEDNEKSGRGRGRTRSRKERSPRSKPAEDAATAVAGLEVIDVVTADDADSGLAIAEPDGTPGPDETPLASVDPIGTDEVTDVPTVAEVKAEPAPVEVAEVAPAEPPVEEVVTMETVADAPETPIIEEAPEDTSNSDETDGPKTMAEAAGLEDEDRVTEEVGDPASAQTVNGEDAVADQPVEAPATEPTSDVEAKAPEQPTDAPATVEEPVKAEAAAEPGEQASDEEAPTKKPRRKRRSRSSKKPEKVQAEGEEGQSEDEDGTEGESVEQVGAEDTLEEAARARTRLRRKYKIQDVIKVRQILLVQVVKEERGNKGAALTTYLSLAGRYCVLMPNTARGGGISRKITNASDRKRLREITGGLEVTKGMGLIVRTAGAERTKAEIKRDYEFLSRQWEQIRDLTLKSIAPTLIYEEGSLIKRSIRDVYSKEIDQILVEGETGYREAKEYMKMLMPSHAKNVQPYTDQTPLFSRFQVESYLNGMFNPTVQLKSGGYIVIGITEALVAIDVNSGRATKQGSIEETALQTNLEASDEVARQLRLRDLAGLIVIDFIDMDENRNNRAVEKRMKDRLKNDRARIQVGRISAFGLMEMSRQRLRPGMLEATTQPCPHCLGVGLIRSDENLSLSILREVEEEALRNRADQITVRAPIDVANYLINHKRPHIAQLEARHQIEVLVMADPSLNSPNYQIERAKTSNKRPVKQAEVITAESGTTEASTAVVEDAEIVEDTRTDEEQKSRRRRGKRGGRRKRGGDQAEGAEPQQNAESGAPSAENTEDEEKPRNRRGRGRRRGGRGRGDGNEDGAQTPTAETEAQSEASSSSASEPAPEAVKEPETATAPEAPVKAEVVPEAAPAPEPTPEPVMAAEQAPQPEKVSEPAPVEAAAPEEPAKPKKRGWWSFGG